MTDPTIIVAAALGLIVNTLAVLGVAWAGGYWGLKALKP